MTRPEGASEIGVSGNVIAGSPAFTVWPPVSKPPLGSAVRVLEPTANIEGAAVEEAPYIMVEEPTTILEAPGPREIGFLATMIGGEPAVIVSEPIITKEAPGSRETVCPPITT